MAYDTLGGGGGNGEVGLASKEVDRPWPTFATHEGKRRRRARNGRNHTAGEATKKEEAAALTTAIDEADEERERYGSRCFHRSRLTSSS